MVRSSFSQVPAIDLWEDNAAYGPDVDCHIDDIDGSLSLFTLL
jgi:hypothetical protein